MTDHAEPDYADVIQRLRKLAPNDMHYAAVSANTIEMLVEERDEARTRIWECPECAFGFDRIHVNQNDGTLSCPLCEMAKVEKERDEARAEVAKLRERDERDVEDLAAFYTWLDSEEAVQAVRIALRDSYLTGPWKRYEGSARAALAVVRRRTEA